jgi:hypothetical protein
MSKLPEKKPFDLSDGAWESSLPPTGVHNATVVSARVRVKNEIAWLTVTFELVGEDGVIHHIEDLLNVDAPGSSSRLAQGKGRLRAILIANRKPISFASVEQTPDALIGCRVSVVVGRRIKDGLPVPIIESIQGPASDARALPQAAE